MWAGLDREVPGADGGGCLRRPGGGVRGGEIVAEGTPETAAADAASVTGFYLKPLLERQAAAVVVEAAPVKKGRTKFAA